MGAVARTRATQASSRGRVDCRDTRTECGDRGLEHLLSCRWHVDERSVAQPRSTPSWTDHTRRPRTWQRSRGWSPESRSQLALLAGRTADTSVAEFRQEVASALVLSSATGRAVRCLGAPTLASANSVMGLGDALGQLPSAKQKGHDRLTPRRTQPSQ